MRSIVIVLTIVSATFAGTTVYLARELQLERERPRAEPAHLTQTTSATPVQPTSAAAESRPVVQRSLPATSTAPESEEENKRRMLADDARRTLKILADPDQRESVQAEYKLMARNSSPRLAKVLGLTNEESERLFTLLAQQQVESAEAYARCAVNPGCTAGELSQPDARDQEIADLLGPGRQQQYETYKNTRLERESVDQLQSRLPDANRLSFEKGEALIAALADERQRIHVEAAQRGAGTYGHASGVGVVFSASDAVTPQAQFDSARANSQRLHERASEVLSADQLRVFDDMQSELLISMRNQIRRKEESSPGS